MAHHAHRHPTAGTDANGTPSVDTPITTPEPPNAPNSPSTPETPTDQPPTGGPSTPSIGEQDPTLSTPTTHVGTLIIAWASGQEQAQSPYIPLGQGPFPFTVSASQGEAVATTPVQGTPSASGTLAWGTALQAPVPGYGQTTTVTLTLPDHQYTWTLAKESLPQVQPFDFGTLTLAWNDSNARVASPYLDIQGLEHIARPFTITGTGNPRLLNNVASGNPAHTGTVTSGTSVGVDAPGPGAHHVVSIKIGEATGQWIVRRAPAPQADNAPPTDDRFGLTSNNGANFAQISFAARGVPQRPYPFTLTGTGSTQPTSNGQASGNTDSWGINIAYNAPPRGVSETITLVINGQRLQWTATGW